MKDSTLKKKPNIPKITDTFSQVYERQKYAWHKDGSALAYLGTYMDGYEE